jgi:hypothetical protein
MKPDSAPEDRPLSSFPSRYLKKNKDFNGKLDLHFIVLLDVVKTSLSVGFPVRNNSRVIAQVSP